MPRAKRGGGAGGGSATPDGPPKKRVKIAQRFPVNLLFEAKVEELHRDAKAKGKKSAASYFKALQSLRRYKLPLETAAQAKVLNGVGDSIVAVLRDTLQTFVDRNAAQPPSLQQMEDLKAGRPVAFLGQAGPGLTQPLPDMPSDDDDAPGPSRRSPGPTRAPAKASAAAKLSSKTSSQGSSKGSSADSAAEEEAPFVLWPDSYDVVLLADVGEHRNREVLERELAEEGLEWRRLPAADFLWVARSRERPAEELILDTLVERKRLDDLRSSLIGKASGGQERWRDQKERMKGSGCANLVLLVEEHALHSGQVPLSTLRTAVNNAQCHEDFQVAYTNSAKESAAYLKALGRALRAEFKDGVLLSEGCSLEMDGARRLVSWSAFRSAGRGTRGLGVGEVWARQLCVCPRMTPGKALGVAELYPTPALFLEAADVLGHDALAKALDDAVRDERGLRLGPALAQALCRFFAN